jgi:hypothetical protein
MPRYPGFVGPAYVSPVIRADRQRSINLYPEIIESGAGQNSMVLRSTPGLGTAYTVGSGPIRALWSGDDRVFAVSGTGLYELPSTQLNPSLALENDGRPAEIHANGDQLFIVSGGVGYIHNGTDLAVAAVPATDDHDEGDVSSGAYLDGYFIAARPQSRQVNISNLAPDGGTWGALDFANKEAHVDNIVRLFADHQELWVFGDETTEVWRNTGNADFPFERDPGAIIHLGCFAPYSVVRFANSIGWIGADSRGGPVAYIAQGYVPVRVSNHAIEAEWGQFQTADDAVAFSYDADGHTFWVVNFPFGTWVYDLTTKQWHQRAYGASLQQWLGWTHAYTGTWASDASVHLVGSRSDGAIYYMSNTLTSDAGTAIRRIRTAPYISDDERYTFHHSFQLEAQVEGPISDATLARDIKLRYSDDGGTTWSNDITVTGAQDRRRMIWRRLGESRDRVYEVEMAQEGKLHLIEAYLNLTPGNS